METKEQSADTAPAKSGRISLVMALTVGITVGAAVGSFVVGPLLADAPVEAPDCEVLAEGEEGSAKGATAVHTIENLVLNPAQSGGTRFLVSTVAISVRDSAAIATISQRDSEVRDVLLRILGSKTVMELTDMESRNVLKEELREELQTRFGKAVVREIYFPQFVIQ